jgi:hypothetical protein
VTFLPGQSGNPSGTTGRKIFVDALQCMISRPWEGSAPELPPKPLVAHAMAQKLIAGALRDDWKPGESLAYMQEICDRAYGKSTQSIDAAVKVTHEVDNAQLARQLAFIMAEQDAQGIVIEGNSTPVLVDAAGNEAVEESPARPESP